MVILYDLLFLLFSVVYLPALLFKGKWHRRFFERFGIFDRERLLRLRSFEGAVWIHAVSVGEVACVRRLIECLAADGRGRPLVVSTTTKAGNLLAEERLAPLGVAVIYAPLDLSWIASRVIGIVRPALFGMVETELWPNLITALSARSVPVVLLNGRISDRSFPRYRSVSWFMKPLLERVSRFCMQSETDASRIIAIGAPAASVVVTGNLKFDSDASIAGGADAISRARARLGIGKGELLFIAGSTHPGEEEVVLAAYRQAKQRVPALRLLLAPRHIERAPAVEKAVQECGFEFERVSQLGEGRRNAESVLILDTIGELKDLYAAAAVAFVGGSLVKHGGQNPIEPARYGCPVIFGEYMFNFRDIAALFLQRGGAVKVNDGARLAAVLWHLAEDEAERKRIGESARRLLEEGRGALARTAEEMNVLLSSRQGPA